MKAIFPKEKFSRY